MDEIKSSKISFVNLESPNTFKNNFMFGEIQMAKRIPSLIMPIVALSLIRPVLSETSANLIHDAEQSSLNFL